MTAIRIGNEQTAYDLGYENPSVLPNGVYSFEHMVVANAYFCGQADAQNHVPRSAAYNRDDYSLPTCERKHPWERKP